MNQRGTGILLHITSLPSRFGIGDLGSSAYRFVDFLQRSGVHYWQILPVNPTDQKYDNSPYHAKSTFAFNTLLISPDFLVRDGYLSEDDIRDIPHFPLETVQYDEVTAYKVSLFTRSYQRFFPQDKGKFLEFCRDNAWWLDDFTVFIAIKEYLSGSLWIDWPENICDRKPGSLAELSGILKERIEMEKFLQFIFVTQWNSLRNYCIERDVRIIGDLPIYIDHDSSDLWAHPYLFKLDKHHTPTGLSGVPPDHFSSKGQLWGTPVYNWDENERTGFDWWIRRIRHAISYTDYLRIDHFRGLVSYWEIPAAEKNATLGRWMPVPTEAFISKISASVPDLPIIAEDLGVITPDVRLIMEKYHLPGMKVLLFAFTGGSDNPYLLHNHIQDCLLYTGTHDNNTIIGWWENISPEEKERVIDYIGEMKEGADISRILIRHAMMSVANTVIIPMQDLLGLGSGARMNCPGTEKDNWRWRCREDQITQHLSDTVKKMIQIYGREQKDSL